MWRIMLKGFGVNALVNKGQKWGNYEGWRVWEWEIDWEYFDVVLNFRYERKAKKSCQKKRRGSEWEKLRLWLYYGVTRV